MGRIYFRQFYTSFVEYCFRAVFHNWKNCDLPNKWLKFTTEWIGMLSEEDKYFIHFVFGQDFYNTAEGLSCYNPSEDYYLKRRRLFSLERSFAMAGGLIDEQSEADRLGGRVDGI